MRSGSFLTIPYSCSSTDICGTLPVSLVSDFAQPRSLWCSCTCTTCNPNCCISVSSTPIILYNSLDKKQSPLHNDMYSFCLGLYLARTKLSHLQTLMAYLQACNLHTGFAGKLPRTLPTNSIPKLSLHSSKSSFLVSSPKCESALTISTLLVLAPETQLCTSLPKKYTLNQAHTAFSTHSCLVLMQLLHWPNLREARISHQTHNQWPNFTYKRDITKMQIIFERPRH